MKYASDSQLTLEELKQLNAQDMNIVKDVDCQVTVTEKNWAGVTNLLRRVSEQQLELMEAQKALLTAQDIENHLAWQENRIQDQLDTLSSEVKNFKEQAGSLSESFSSASDKLVSKTDAELTKLTENTSTDQKRILDTTRRMQAELMSSAKQQMLKLLITSAGSATLLAVFYSLLMFLKN